MKNIDEVIEQLSLIEKASYSELKRTLKDFDGLDITIKAMEDYEEEVADLLKKQIKHIQNGLNKRIRKAENDEYETLLDYLADIAEDDEFEKEFSAVTAIYFRQTIEDLTKFIMNVIDKDVQFNKLSPRTLKWIEDTSDHLAEVMNLTSYDAVQRALKRGLEEGKGIPSIVRELSQLPEFDEVRARRTAQTEILAANAHSQHEAYNQSPAVKGKRWKHSGARGIDPRPAHVLLSGTIKKLDEKFNVNGYYGMYPRDWELPAKERVNCHCTIGPVVDENILKLPPDEKKKLHEQRMEEMK